MRDWNYRTVRGFDRCRNVCSVPMRDWNFCCWKGNWSAKKFVAYLWGIETFSPSKSGNDSNLVFVAYLWGIETALYAIIALWKKLFVAYLWGIETFLLQQCVRWPPHVCSVPMRDWNYFCSKLFNAIFCVCSVPMRDWNSLIKQVKYSPYPTFVAYLWGIETVDM